MIYCITVRGIIFLSYKIKQLHSLKNVDDILKKELRSGCKSCCTLYSLSYSADQLPHKNMRN
jgi:hypothetical protein